MSKEEPRLIELRRRFNKRQLWLNEQKKEYDKKQQQRQLCLHDEETNHDNFITTPHINVDEQMKQSEVSPNIINKNKSIPEVVSENLELPILKNIDIKKLNFDRLKDALRVRNLHYNGEKKDLIKILTDYENSRYNNEYYNEYNSNAHIYYQHILKKITNDDNTNNITRYNQRSNNAFEMKRFINGIEVINNIFVKTPKANYPLPKGPFVRPKDH